MISWTRLLSDSSWYCWFSAIGEPAEPADQQRADRRLRAGRDGHPPRKGQRLVDGREAPLHLHRPSLQRSMRETTQATIGKARSRSRSGGTTVRKGSEAPMTWATRHSAASFASEQQRLQGPIRASSRATCAPIDEVERKHRRSPQRDGEADRMPGDQVVDEAQAEPPTRPARRPPGAAASDQSEKAEIRDTSRWSETIGRAVKQAGDDHRDGRHVARARHRALADLALSARAPRGPSLRLRGAAGFLGDGRRLVRRLDHGEAGRRRVGEGQRDCAVVVQPARPGRSERAAGKARRSRR